MNKKIAVLFSGGLDSTFLIYKNLKEGNIVQPYYVTVENNYAKVKAEKRAIIDLYLLFKQDYGNKIEEPIEIIKAELKLPDGLLLVQPTIWFFAIQYMNEHDEIHMGYVLNDDAISYLDDFKKYYKSMDFLFYKDYKRPLLKFPLIKHMKEEIVKELPEKYFKHTFTCENPSLSDEKFEYDPEKIESLSYGFKGKFLEIEKNDTIKYVYNKASICGECIPCKKILSKDYPRRKLINMLLLI
jgi:7-cyano-7-deazaguanine synthase in queuosine biosynthesis